MCPARPSFFQRQRCTLCGECFTRCRYLDLSREQAIAEIQRLIQGQPTRAVLQACTGCASCDAFCPEQAEPYQLILERWERRFRETGLPARASYMLPLERPNYREDMVEKMAPRERELLAQWQAAPAAGEVLYPGCNLLTVPLLFDLKVLQALPVSGDWSLCCGEPFYRLGAFDLVERIAAGLTAYYSTRSIRKMVFACPACLNMFRKILPQRFGASFNFECEYLVPWLLRKLDAGEIRVRQLLGRTVSVHDSCHGRLLGEEVMGQTRELYRRLGLQLLELKSHHENGICCGIAAGCNRQMPQDIVTVGRRALRKGLGAGTREMAVYCTGCYLHLGIIQRLAPTPQKLMHTLEYLAEAAGEQVPRRLETKARAMLWNIVTKPLPKMLSRRRYRPKIK